MHRQQPGTGVQCLCERGVGGNGNQRIDKPGIASVVIDGGEHSLINVIRLEHLFKPIGRQRFSVETLPHRIDPRTKGRRSRALGGAGYRNILDP